MGYVFAQVRPRGDRDYANNTIAVTYLIDEGPRAYVERIDIRGNTKTRDYVIRREFDISEGDAYNRVLIDKAERRLRDLGFFKTVAITTEPGSAPDKVVRRRQRRGPVDGSFSVGGGVSTERRPHRRSRAGGEELPRPRPDRAHFGRRRRRTTRPTTSRSPTRISSATACRRASTPIATSRQAGSTRPFDTEIDRRRRAARLADHRRTDAQLNYKIANVITSDGAGVHSRPAEPSPAATSRTARA